MFIGRKANVSAMPKKPISARPKNGVNSSMGRLPLIVLTTERGKANLGKLAYSFATVLQAVISSVKSGFKVFLNAVEIVIVSDRMGARTVEIISPPPVKFNKPKPYLLPAPKKLCVNWYVLIGVNFLWRVYQ